MKIVLALILSIFGNVTRTLAAVLLILSSASSSATVLTFSTADSLFDDFAYNQGYWSSVGSYNEQDWYLTGENALGSYRGFFTFDLSGLTETVVGATLRVMRGGQGVVPMDVQLSLWDVTTPAHILNNNAGINLDIMADLGSGISYGSYLIEPNLTPGTTFGYGDYLLLPLNGDALASINAARGFFSIGARTGPMEEGMYDGQLFGLYTGAAVTYLDLIIQSPVPVSEPATNVLLGFGILCLVISRRRGVKNRIT